jgi:hypothetical protein
MFRAGVIAAVCAVLVGANAFSAQAQAVPGPEAHPSVHRYHHSVPPPDAHAAPSPDVGTAARVASTAREVASKPNAKHRRHKHGRKSADTMPMATNPVATP